ncbi:hypothetical protein V1264_007033 [Littorina saxatilis]|uniref:MAM domain-containing protein n=1 Tax=Littorina saxatilis TaxID=31220 RepID=A0AAN9G382_9CAEN
MNTVRVLLVIFITLQEAKATRAVCSNSVRCDFESTYCEFDDGSNGTDTDTWFRGSKWEMLHGHRGRFMYAYRGSADNSGRTTVDLTSPSVCSQTPIQVSFEYIVNKNNSQLQVLTRCDGQDSTDVHTYSQHVHTWKNDSITLYPCPHGDTTVVFRGSLNVASAVGVDTVSIMTGKVFDL